MIAYALAQHWPSIQTMRGLFVHWTWFDQWRMTHTSRGSIPFSGGVPFRHMP